MERQPLVSRVLISLLTALSFVAMSLSGIAAFIVPQGRVAYWTNWTFLGLSKTDWGSIHITTSVLFLVAGIWHTCYNWTPLVQYLRGIPGKVAGRWRDLAIAAVITLFFTVGAVTKTPPLNYILDLNSWIKDAWVRTPADDPPFGHAELLSLKGFCRKMYIDTGAALTELRQAGITVADENVTLERMARDNGTTPAKIYEVIRKLEQPEPPAAAPTGGQSKAPATAPASPTAVKVKPAASMAVAPQLPRYTPDLVMERFEGKGIGRKTLAAICQELQLDCGAIRRKLAAQKIELKDDESIKAAADRLDMVPIELLTAILVGEPIH